MAPADGTSHVFDPVGAAEWLPLLRSLDWFLHHRDLSDATSDVQRLHDKLVSETPMLLEPHVLDDLSAHECERLFAHAVLLLERLAQAVMGREQALDTAGSWTLPLYAPDYADKPGALEQRCREILSLGDATYDALRERIDADLSDARQKQSVVAAIRDEFDLHTDSEDLESAEEALFHAIHPDVPLCAADLGIVVTGTLIFVCIRCTNGRSSRHDALSETERQAVSSFLEQIAGFAAPRYANFPAFGFVDSTRVDRSALRRLSRRCGLSEEAVSKEIAHTITMLPIAEMEKYLVHDVWGHSYQASMLQFERFYERITTFDAPIRLRDSEALQRCFSCDGTSVRFDESRFRTFVVDQIDRRLPVALAPVLAEMMADVAEFKLLATFPSLIDALPSSSRLKHHPSKLDLTLRDVDVAFGEATRAIIQLADAGESYVTDLCDLGAERSSAETAVQELRSSAVALLDGLLARSLRYEPVADDALSVNIWTRLMMGFVGLHGSVLRTWDELDATHPGRLPLRGFKDLLVLGASVFFEADPHRNIWRLDEFLELRFIELCRRFAGETTTPAPEM